MPDKDSRDDEMKRWLNQIAIICLSKDFRKLKQELEAHYRDAQIEDVQLRAFQDALYTFLAQKDDEMKALHFQAY